MGVDALTLTQVNKTYATGTVALNDVSLTIPAGGFYALLGPNGAGKTTLIGIVMGLVEKSAGQVKVFGIDTTTHPYAAKAQMGIVPQEVNFNPFEKCLDIVVNQAGYYGIPRREALPRAEALLRSLGLGEKLHQPARTLSGGMKRRLLVAKAMVHSPPVIVLDEPTAGVDIELRQQLWDYVVELNKGGTTVVLTTHYLEEAEQLCDRIAIINHGRLITDKPTRELVGMAREKAVLLTLDRDIDTAPVHPAFEKVERIADRTIEITYNKDRMNAGEVLAAVQGLGLGIIDVTTKEADLEDVFLSLTSGSAE